MKEEEIKYNIIICIKNALPEVQKCLFSICKETTGSYKVFLINDNSNENTSNFISEFCRKHQQFSVITNPQTVGYTKSVNIGLKSADADFVICLNSDTVVTRNWAIKLLNPILNDSDIGITSPLSNAALWQSVPEILDQKGKYKINSLPIGLNLESFSLEIEKEFYGQYTEVKLINGFCLCTRMSLIKELGYFDEVNFPIGYGEETDFCIKTAMLGYKLLVKLDTYVYHFKSSSFGEIQRIKLSTKGRNTLDALYGFNTIEQIHKSMKEHSELIKVRNLIKNKYY
jgi:O-antigen biosynthesis protein